MPAPSLSNSPRLDQCIHDGKLYLSIDDAIDPRSKTISTSPITRYDLPIANMDVLRTAAGQFFPRRSRPSAKHVGWRECLECRLVCQRAAVVPVAQAVLVQTTDGLGIQVPSFDP